MNAQKIDILCRDLISAQRNFIKRLGTISFTANFYEAIIGTNDLSDLLCTASKLIRDEIGDCNVVFFLFGADHLALHTFESGQPITHEHQHLENYFTPEIVDNICKANKLCTLDDMFAMGLQGNLIKLSEISAFTIPLGQFGSSLGFILVYHTSQNTVTAEELSKVSVVTCGLSRAIQSCQMLLHSAD